MKRDVQPAKETLQLHFDAIALKELLRDLLFREAGKPYFKRLAIPRRRRLLGAWRALPTYKAERQLLPVGGRNIDQLIRQFFTTHERLRAEFQEGGMPINAIYVLRQHCLPLRTALEHIHVLECSLNAQEGYSVSLIGGLAPPPQPGAGEAGPNARA